MFILTNVLLFKVSNVSVGHGPLCVLHLQPTLSVTRVDLAWRVTNKKSSPILFYIQHITGCLCCPCLILLHHGLVCSQLPLSHCTHFAFLFLIYVHHTYFWILSFALLLPILILLFLFGRSLPPFCQYWLWSNALCFLPFCDRGIVMESGLRQKQSQYLLFTVLSVFFIFFSFHVSLFL